MVIVVQFKMANRNSKHTHTHTQVLFEIAINCNAAYIDRNYYYYYIWLDWVRVRLVHAVCVYVVSSYQFMQYYAMSGRMREQRIRTPVKLIAMQNSYDYKINVDDDDGKQWELKYSYTLDRRP